MVLHEQNFRDFKNRARRWHSDAHIKRQADNDIKVDGPGQNYTFTKFQWTSRRQVEIISMDKVSNCSLGAK